MNLHGLVRGAIPLVNPDSSVTVKASAGFTTLPNGKKVPNYTTIPGVSCQVQPIDAGEIKHLDALNIQGVLKGFWFYGSIQGLNRPLQKGGDLITLGDGTEWLVVHVFEDWSMTAGWSHVAGQLQNAS